MNGFLAAYFIKRFRLVMAGKVRCALPALNLAFNLQLLKVSKPAKLSGLDIWVLTYALNGYLYLYTA